MRHALFAFALLASAVAGAPVPKAVKAKAPALDGTWELVQQNNNDLEVPKLSPWKWEIAGDKLYRHSGNGDGSFSREKQNCWLVRPADGGPDDLDYVTGHDRTSQAYKCRVSVSGDEMVVCWTDGNGSRPTESKPGPKVNYYRFKRMPDK